MAVMIRIETTSPAAVRVNVAPQQNRAVAWWLLACCALLFAIVVVGGVTRLTHSGLSIVEWQPIVGTLPPLNQEQWQETFLKYQQTPEYQRVNQGMSVEAFKGIFWLEYFHRLLGRLIGVAFLLPLLWFALRGGIERRLVPRLIGIFVLGGLQGAMGWYMVKSGLVDDPRVSQYRLTAHLGLAFLIYMAMLWVALDILFIMSMTGAFVAGIRAGLAYNTFPLMNGEWLPAGMFVIAPWYLNFFSNIPLVQFDHRVLAWALAFLVPWFWWRARADTSPRVRLGAHLLLAALVVQTALGIATLLLVVPVPLAAAHQAGALLVFTAALFVAHSLR
jgi:cytochrome c oxidase assembly protein subunit 15